MMSEQIGDELTALPHIGNDPTKWLDPESDNELAPWGAVKALSDGGGSTIVDELKELISRILPVGRMEFSPFRAGELPTGWYVMNGQTFLDTSPQGTAIMGMSQNFRDDWGIVRGANYMVNVPNFLNDGKGYFVRAVDGTARRVGSVQQDAGRKLGLTADGKIGTFKTSYGNAPPNAGGIFSVVQDGIMAADDISGGGVYMYNATVSMDGGAIQDPEFAADEYRPVNIGMTPCIYLGV